MQLAMQLPARPKVMIMAIKTQRVTLMMMIMTMITMVMMLMMTTWKEKISLKIKFCDINVSAKNYLHRRKRNRIKKTEIKETNRSECY